MAGTDSYVAGYFGRRGAGKTLTMTAMAYSWMYSPLCIQCGRMYRISNSSPSNLTVKEFCPRCEVPLVNNKMLGWKVFDNYGVKFADASHENIAEYISQFPDELEKTVLLIDEQHAVAPGKRAMSSLNLMYVLFMEQLRKRQVHFFYTAQNPLKIDRGIFWQTDVAIRCKASEKGHNIHMEMYDQWGNWSDDEDAYEATWPPQREPDRYAVLQGAYKFWGLYDTDQIVLPTEWYKRKNEQEKSLGLHTPVNLDPETPEGKSVKSEIDKAFSNILRDGVDYNILKGKFTRVGMSEASLQEEIRNRGFRMERAGAKKKVMPPEVAV